MSEELDLIEENKKYYEQELADMEYKLFGIKRTKTKDQQIADLEAKLAESEIRSKESEIFYKREINRRDTKLRNIKQQLAEKDEQIERRVAVYEKNFIEQTDEIYKLKQQLAMQENTITNLVEDNRASQEWYKKQLEEKDERINWLVEAEFNRKWAKKYVEMRRKEDPMLCLPDSDEVYEKYFEQKEYIEKLEADLDQAFELDDIYAEKLRKRHEDYEKMKIEFAVEQLEKVKEMLQPYLRFDINLYLQTIQNIDNQIKAIKGEK